jgi:F-box protein 11
MSPQSVRPSASQTSDWSPAFLHDEGGVPLSPEQYAGLVVDQEKDKGGVFPPPAVDLWPADEPAPKKVSWHRRKWPRVGLASLLLVALAAGGYRLWGVRPHVKDEKIGEKKPAVETEPAGDIVVAANGGGRYKSLAEAVRLAPAGARIRVKPGVYKGGVVLDKKLEIVGDGPRQDIVLESIGYPCIEMGTDEALIKGLTLSSEVGEFSGDCFTVAIPKGRLVVEDCDIRSKGSVCVGILNEGSSPRLSNCDIHDGRAGVVFRQGSAGLVEKCNIHNHLMSGVVVSGKSAPMLRDCTITNCAQNGVYVFDHAAGEFESCTLTRNGNVGVGLDQEAATVFQHCTIEEGSGVGVLTGTKSHGQLILCIIRGNAKDGVMIRTGAETIFTQCKIQRNKVGGVYVDQAGGTLAKCEITDNDQDGVFINQGNNTTVKGCDVLRNGLQGIVVQNKSKVAIQDCLLTDNKKGPGSKDAASTITGGVTRKP